MRFAIAFHGGFRVATGAARASVDDTVDRDNPLPGSALKGLMRAAARTLLPGTGNDEHPLVATVFGTPQRPCPWNWDSAVLAAEPRVHTRAHVQIDEHGAAARDTLRHGEEVWARAATFEITRCGPVDEADRHELLLACAAHAVHAVGSDRRRGLGWVSVRSLDRPVSPADVTDLISLRPAPTGRADRGDR